MKEMLTGVYPGHGPMGVKAVNTPVSICGMDAAPGEIIHMDENGAVKIPRIYLREVPENPIVRTRENYANGTMGDFYVILSQKKMPENPIIKPETSNKQEERLWITEH